MAIVKIPKEVGDSPQLINGNYEDGVRVVMSEVRDMPGANAEPGETWWDIGVLVPTPKGGVFAHTQPFGPHKTSLVPNSGSKAFLFARQLGIGNPEEGFDPDSILGKDVVVEIKVREWADKDDPDVINRRAGIANIFLK